MRRYSWGEKPLSEWDEDNVLIGTLSACIAGDCRYKETLSVFYHPSTDGVTVEITSIGAAGGMDTPSSYGTTPRTVDYSWSSKGPISPKELVSSIKWAIRQAGDTIRSYGKPTINFRWIIDGQRVSGINARKAAEALESAKFGESRFAGVAKRKANREVYDPTYDPTKVSVPGLKNRRSREKSLKADLQQIAENTALSVLDSLFTHFENLNTPKVPQHVRDELIGMAQRIFGPAFNQALVDELDSYLD